MSNIGFRLKCVLKVVLCFVFIWMIPILAYSEHSSVKGEWRHWKHDVQMFCIEAYFGVKFTDSQRMALYKEGVMDEY